jgi:zinc protease
MALDAGNDVVERTLQNGLGLLVKPDHTAPLASVWTWYRVGSRNERVGQTGASHWVEHMQFKGTPSLAKGQIFAEVSRVGGALNALTSLDWTAYFETVPVSALDLPLRIESDRIVNSLFETDEVEAERTVILSERHGAMNNPGYRLYEEVLSEAFRNHPYRNMVIGHENDLRLLSRDDLYAHYRRFYQPANAFVVAVGDFDADSFAEKIELAFGHIAPDVDRSQPPPVPQEPPQLGERRVRLRLPAGSPYLRLAYHVPDASSPDLVPLLVTEAVLSGGKAMGFGGSGGMGRSSRLYRALIATGLARAAISDVDITLDPFLFQIAVTGLPGADLATIEDTVQRELQQLRDVEVPQEELDRAVRQVEAQLVYSSEGVTNQAFWLGQWQLLNNWRRALTLPDEIRRVSAVDVQRVSRQYFRPDQSVVGWLEPQPNGSDGASNEDQTARPLVSTNRWFLSTGASTGQQSQPFDRAVLDNGIAVLGQDRPHSRSVALRVRVRAGAIAEPPGRNGLAYLTARSLLRGSGGLTYAEINERTDRAGSAIAVDAGREFAEIRLRCLGDDLPDAIELVAQMVMQPDFPDEEIDLVRNEQLGAIAETDNDTRSTADRIMRRHVYPEPNPLGSRLLGSSESVASLRRAEITSYWSTKYQPRTVTIAAVGALGGFNRTLGLIAAAFERWWPPTEAASLPDLSFINQERHRSTVQITGKSQSDLAVGLATISRLHPDYYALDLANHILGRQGLMGRLGSEVRDRLGLAYYTFSQIEPRRDGSLWVARAGVDPGKLDRALEAIQDELERMRTALVSEDELSDAQSQLVGTLPLALETHDGVASTLLAIEEFDLGLDYLSRYPDLIHGTTRERCLEAATLHLDPQRLVVGVAEPSLNGHAG